MKAFDPSGYWFVLLIPKEKIGGRQYLLGPKKSVWERGRSVDVPTKTATLSRSVRFDSYGAAEEWCDPVNLPEGYRGEPVSGLKLPRRLVKPKKVRVLTAHGPVTHLEDQLLLPCLEAAK